MRSISFGLTLIAALLVAAGCSGGSPGSAPAPVPTSTGASTQSASETAVTATNAVGAPMSTLSDYNNATSSLQSIARSAQAVTLAACQTTASGGSFEFFSPDKNGDPNSTEQQYFYDTACTQLARDAVRTWVSTGAASETVTRTVRMYASGNATPIATRNEAVTERNAVFDQYGFAMPASGFARAVAGTLQYSGVNAVASDDELVVNAASGSSQTFCGDSAGFNANGIAVLNETFGWQGSVLSSGTRQVNTDGSVTWTATHTGTSVNAANGTLAISAGTQNTACPIATPMFTLTGGTASGNYSIPAVATFKSGLLTGLTVNNAILANGTTLNVTTNASVSPAASNFISGVVANAGTQVATFTVDAFGDGTLTVSSGGSQYVIVDWHVVK